MGSDWADTLRSELDYHAAVRLGLRRSHGGRAAVMADDLAADMADEPNAPPEA